MELSEKEKRIIEEALSHPLTSKDSFRLKSRCASCLAIDDSISKIDIPRSVENSEMMKFLSSGKKIIIE